ncbi:acyltransferase family protein [Mycolicibacterium goodii]|uniref:acyltransferase family protein n=1 Tax=Mycolicibacterium goodii TaxID=134601 RepID=UPI001C20E53B
MLSAVLSASRRNRPGDSFVQITQSDPVLAAAVERRAPDDLTGLVGIAIAWVMIGQVWFGQVDGGVDILLVVVGFVFGRRLLRTCDVRATARWLVRRWMPALIVVIAACAVLTVLIQPQTRWEDFADQTLASLGFYQNWQILGSAEDYLQASEAVTPLYHLWVVSAAAQILLIVLVLAGLSGLGARRAAQKRRRTILVASVAITTVASLVYATITSTDNELLTYYSSLARAWELLAGVLAAACVTRVHWPRWLRSPTVLVGVATLVASGTLLGGMQQYPGPWALIPVGATVLIILAAANAPTWAHRVLSCAPAAGLGAMAYSLYLWHWPLLIFWFAYTNEDAVGVTAGTIVVLVSVGLAWLTWRCAERRQAEPAPHTHRGWLGGSLIVLMMVTLTLTSFAWRGHVAGARAGGADLSTLPLRDYPGGLALVENRKVAKLPMRPSALEASHDVPPSTLDGCVTNFPDTDVNVCVYGDPKAQRTIALAGGSHSEHWLTALHTLGRQHGFRVTTYLKMGCPLTTKEVPLIAGPFEPYPACRTWADAAMRRIIDDRPDYVFFTTTRPVLNGPGDYVPDYYLGIWDELSANGIRMLGIRDTPWMIRDGRFFAPVDCLSDGGDADSCGMPRHEALAQRNPTLDHLADYPLMDVLDLSDAVCRPDRCRAVEGNVLIYHDIHHLSATYVRTLADELARQLSDATGWW